MYFCFHFKETLANYCTCSSSSQCFAVDFEHIYIAYKIFHNISNDGTSWLILGEINKEEKMDIGITKIFIQIHVN